MVQELVSLSCSGDWEAVVISERLVKGFRQEILQFQDISDRKSLFLESIQLIRFVDRSFCLKAGDRCYTQRAFLELELITSLCAT